MQYKVIFTNSDGFRLSDTVEASSVDEAKDIFLDSTGLFRDLWFPLSKHSYIQLIKGNVSTLTIDEPEA